MSVYQTLFNLTVMPPQPYGQLRDDVVKIIKGTATTNSFAVLALPPKVAGTFLRQSIISALGVHYEANLYRGSWSTGDQQRDFYFPSFLHHYVSKYEKPRNMITHSHVHATIPNTSILEVFNIPTIVGSRNIYDTLVSFFDMVNNPKTPNHAVECGFIMQTGLPYGAMTEEEKRFQLVNVAPAWFARYYRTWIDYVKDCKAAGKSVPFWFTYADIISDPYGTLKAILKHLDPAHDYPDELVKGAYDQASGAKDNLRFNKGVTGRGDAFFTEDEKAHIRRIMATDPAFEQDLIDYGVL